MYATCPCRPARDKILQLSQADMMDNLEKLLAALRTPCYSWAQGGQAAHCTLITGATCAPGCVEV
jgi:hypothetical protein